MTNRLQALAPLATALLIGSSQITCADIVTIGPSADTCLFEFNPDDNWGLEPEIVSGVLGENGDDLRCRALTKFDIDGAVPSGSTITAARLTLTATKTPPGAPSSNFHLLRVLSDWVEGTQVDGEDPPGGAPAATGETTWNHRIFSGTPWNAPGGALEIDYAEDPSSQHTVSGNSSEMPLTNSTNIFDFNLQGIADLNSMLAIPNINYGWVLLPQDEVTPLSARRWAAREHSTRAPQLEITFSPTSPGLLPPTIINSFLHPISGNLVVEFNTLIGHLYDLEIRTHLGSGSWIPAVPNVPGTNSPVTVSTAPPPGSRRLFFRITKRVNDDVPG